VIVRILGEGQLEVPDGQLTELEPLDDRLAAAVDTGDELGFARALAELLEYVRRVGEPLPAGELRASDLVLPSRDAGLAEVRELLEEEGLIPG
jgi:hypothetical protein